MKTIGWQFEMTMRSILALAATAVTWSHSPATARCDFHTFTGTPKNAKPAPLQAGGATTGHGPQHDVTPTGAQAHPCKTRSSRPPLRKLFKKIRVREEAPLSVSICGICVAQSESCQLANSSVDCKPDAEELGATRSRASSLTWIALGVPFYREADCSRFKSGCRCLCCSTLTLPCPKQVAHLHLPHHTPLCQSTPSHPPSRPRE